MAVQTLGAGALFPDDSAGSEEDDAAVGGGKWSVDGFEFPGVM